MRKSLQTRTITALVLLAVFVLLLFTLSPRLWEMTTLAIVAIAAWEWAKLAGMRAKIIYALVTAAAGLGLSLFEERSGVIANEYLPATVFWVVLVPLWLALGWKTKSVALLAATGWIVLLPAWLAVVDLRALDPALLLWMMSVIWLADTAAYFAGKAFGKRKLAPIVSPNKTWEGVAGAFSAVALYAILGTVFGLDGYIMQRSAPNANNQEALFFGLSFVLAGASVVGDLYESWMKRAAHAKDTSALLPGHGGVLDRIDGLTSALPLFAFFVTLHA